MTIHTPQTVGLSLERGAVIDFRPAREGVAIDLRQGKLWITQTGDPTDHVLTAGESYRATGGGMLVVEALEPSVLAAR